MKKGDKYVLLEDFLNIPKGAVVVINEDHGKYDKSGMVTISYNKRTYFIFKRRLKPHIDSVIAQAVSKVLSE